MNRTDTPYRPSSRLNKKRSSGSALRGSKVKPRLAVDTDLCRYADFKPNSPPVHGHEFSNPHTKQTSRHKAIRHPAIELPRSAIVCYDESENDLTGTILHGDHNLSTPTVIVTPAYLEQTKGLQHPRRQRAPSSMYSRCVDDRSSPQDETVPPVPPIPQQHLTHEARDPLRLGTMPTSRSWLTRRSPALGGPVASRNGLLSARRTPPRSSHGWWNLVLSPFSARSNASFWRSPPLNQEECTPMLSDVQDSPCSADRSPPRSVSRSQTRSIHSEVDIYSVPSRGEAASYYDRSRNYPSMISPVTGGTCLRKSLHVLPNKNGTSASAHSDLQAERRSVTDTNFTSPAPGELDTPALPDSDCQSAPKRCSSFQKQDIGPLAAGSSAGLAARTMASRPVSSQYKLEQEADRMIERNFKLDQPFGLGILNEEKQAAAEPEQAAPRGGTHAELRPFLRKLLWPVIALAFATTALIVVLLVIYVPQQHQDIPVQAQWVNTTAFPPFPVGILTIIQPRLVRDDSKCVSQPESWSCRSVATAGSDTNHDRTMPDFRFETRFKNDTTFNSSALTAQYSSRRRSVLLSQPVFGRATRLTARDLWEDQKYSAVPAPPSQADQIFMGNTTDNVTVPFDGEPTPFFISLVNPIPLQGNRKRDELAYPLPNDGGATTTAPHASIDLDGKVVPVPFSMASAQPVRLYKRGLPDEHYGFYTYYDRSVIVDFKLANNTSGGRSICTWSQSRFLVQIWTKSIRKSSTVLKAGQAAMNIQAVNSSANAMDAPGSFPYATTITIDRHGGDVDSKGVFCRPINQQGRAAAQGTWVAEDRAIGGALIQPGSIPGGVNSSVGATKGLIDGGTGGCACAWANW